LVADGAEAKASAKTTTEILTGGQNDASKRVNDASMGEGGFGALVGGTRDVAAWKDAEPAGWAEEDACDKAKDEAVDKSPVKGQVWDGLLYRHWDHWTDAKRSHVLVVSAADGAGSGEGVRDLTPASAVGDAETPTWTLGGPLGYAWAPDSQEIAYVTNLDAVPAASTNNDVFTLRLDEAGAKAVKVSTSPGSDDEPEYSPDGKILAFRSQERDGFESGRFQLMFYDREARTIREVTKGYDLWVDEFSWLPNAAGVVVISGDKGEAPIRIISNTDPAMVRERSEPGEFSEVQMLSNGALVASRTGINHPTEIFAAPPLKRLPDGSFASDGEPRMITHLNDQLLNSLDLDQLDTFWFEGAEGTQVQGFLLRPPGFDPAKKYPVKFLMHGGPQTAWGDAWSFRWNWELMAASGYVVVGINRRGSTGYGQKFVDEVSGDWGGRAYEDLMKGLDYVEAKYPFVDKTRECALGASYGGFMADWVLTHTNRFQCIVTHDGMYDPVAAYGATEELWFNEWEFRRPEDFQKGWDGFGGGKGIVIGETAAGKPAQPWRYAGLTADQDPFRKWSPMRFIENAKTPTLIIHSQKDFRLDVSQGFELYTALQRLGVPSKMLYFPDEGHWVQKPQNAQLWNEVVGDWCDRWTKSGKWSVVSGQ
jgi:dipeptidyl aminopeptidase/acylaminoacyl peptidase